MFEWYLYLRDKTNRISICSHLINMAFLFILSCNTLLIIFLLLSSLSLLFSTLITPASKLNADLSLIFNLLSLCHHITALFVNRNDGPMKTNGYKLLVIKSSYNITFLYINNNTSCGLPAHAKHCPIHIN